MTLLNLDKVTKVIEKNTAQEIENELIRLGTEYKNVKVVSHSVTESKISVMVELTK